MSKEIYGTIYKITNLINGKVYIGQTKRSFSERYRMEGEGVEKDIPCKRKPKESWKIYTYIKTNCNKRQKSSLYNDKGDQGIKRT